MKGYHHLTQVQRYIIERQLQRGRSLQLIAGSIGVHRTTVWREIERNGSRKGHYKGRGAEAAARGRKREQYHCRRKIDGVLEQIVVEKLSYGWSPEQISGRLKLEGRGEVSTETIYRYLLFDKKMGGELFKCLRLGRRERRRRFPRRTRFFKISEERKDITKRSLEADRREEAGHWERDLMIGKQSGPAVLAMVDRRSRFTVLERVENRSPGHVGWVTVEALKKRELEVKSLTNDRGIEFYRPSIVERELNAPVYFARAYASWERGTVENTIGLVRQYLAKGQSLEAINPQLLDDIAETLNNRPRKTHGFQTPHEIHFSSQTKQVRSQSFYRRKIYKDQARSLLLAINFGAEPSDVALIP